MVQWARMNAKLFIFLCHYNICLLLLSLKIAKLPKKVLEKSLLLLLINLHEPWSISVGIFNEYLDHRNIFLFS